MGARPRLPAGPDPGSLPVRPAFRTEHLRYFVAVAEEGQVTRAAAKLHIAQPALSQAICNLEAEVGFPLLERHPRGVSTTPAGDAFLVKARLVLDAEADAAQTARSLSRAARREIAVGYLGLPPGLSGYGLFHDFEVANPDVQVCLHELSFPAGPTTGWLAGVDVGLGHPPQREPEVWTLELSSDPRMLLVQRAHPLAKHRELSVHDILDETFIGFDPSVQPSWSGFWSLDDHRGSPAPHVTSDNASRGQELFTLISQGRGVTTSPLRIASIVVKLLGNVVAIPLRDAEPSVLALFGRDDRRNAIVEAIAEMVDARHTDALAHDAPAGV